MVENAYQVTLVAAFVPLAAGVYWKPATTQGAYLAMILGIVTWLGLAYANPDGFWPPQFAGLLMSIFGMVVGSSLARAAGASRSSSTLRAGRGGLTPRRLARVPFRTTFPLPTYLFSLPLEEVRSRKSKGIGSQRTRKERMKGRTMIHGCQQTLHIKSTTKPAAK